MELDTLNTRVMLPGMRQVKLALDFWGVLAVRPESGALATAWYGVG